MNAPIPTDTNVSKPCIIWKRRFWLVVVCWFAFFALGSWDRSRSMLIRPLCKHQADASGDYAYVMAGGPAYWERLRAAADLYHWERVKSIIILDEKSSAGYDFQEQNSMTRRELATKYLEVFGVPIDRISSVSLRNEPWLGTLGEAEAIAESLEIHESLVVVTSAPHTRRSWLAFRRVLPQSSGVKVYAASSALESDELYSPIWLEYTKLIVYFFVAKI